MKSLAQSVLLNNAIVKFLDAWNIRFKKAVNVWAPVLYGATASRPWAAPAAAASQHGCLPFNVWHLPRE